MQIQMSLSLRRELLLSIRKTYQLSCWKEKGKLLDGFIAATGYERKYAINLLHKANDLLSKKSKLHKNCQYDGSVQQALITIWHYANQICSKRLTPFLPDLIDALERHGHLSLPLQIKQKLLTISSATVDRLLKVERQKQPKGMSTTKAGSFLKKQIQVKLYSDWNETLPGFLEADLVAHCGDRVEGSFLNTLVLTDIASTWTEFVPLLHKSDTAVITGLDVIQALLPFLILGVDTDNGSEFINYELLKYCEHKHITFTRSRPYKKNDQAHVEEKNGSIIRRLIGYDRYEGEIAWSALTELYSILRLYINFFQPSLKLRSKERNGAKIVKKYDLAKTPYQRLINCSHISEGKKLDLRSQYEILDPVKLLQDLEKAQNKFWLLAWKNDKELNQLLPQEVQNIIIPPTLNNKLCVTPASLPPNRYYRRICKPLKPRTWRTRKDPFESVKRDICLQLEINPSQTSVELLKVLITKYPKQFGQENLRTLQRRVSEWRKQQYIKEKEHQLLLFSQNAAIDKYQKLVSSATRPKKRPCLVKEQ